MIEIEAVVRKWGRSFGVVIPMELIKGEEISENDKVTLAISKKGNPLKNNFGTCKFKKSTKDLLDESDREAWDE